LSIWKSIFAGTQKPERHYRVPEGSLIYAIGDIHGRLDLLEKLLEKIAADRSWRTEAEKTYIVFLGDYVDRGFQSREVVDFLKNLEDTPELSHIFLAGNHEDLMLGFLDDPLENQLWLRVGGLQTLVSYGIQPPANTLVDTLVETSNALGAALPASHRTFLSSLKTWWRAGGYLFVHAGIRPGIPLEEQRRRDLLGVRQEFTESPADFGFRVVHGHTGVPEVSFYPNRIAVDTGAFATGTLSAVVLWNDAHATLTN